MRRSDASDLPFPWTVIRRLPWGTLVSLSGPPGSGKSSLAALLSVSGWITTENTIADARDLLDRVMPDGRDLPTIVQLDSSEPDALRGALDDVDDGIAVLDSLTAGTSLDLQVEALRVLQSWVRSPGRNRTAIVVRGVTKDGDAAGRRQLDHVVDVVADVVIDDDGAHRLTVTKNRNGPIGSRYFALGETGASSPAFSYSYSVEGKRGAYRLTPFPSDGARWDGLLRSRFVETAEAGYASAARMQPGYPRGVLQPLDVDDRRAFALDHGLRWLEP